jgi:hypothetical protein
MTIRSIDPDRVAELSDVDYSALTNGLHCALSNSRESDAPAELIVRAYRLSRRCGSRVHSYDDLRRVAVQFEGRRLMIERLRRF